MQKVACVFSYQKSSWVSCQKIVFNLYKSYQLLSDLELFNFNYALEQSPIEISRTAQGIFELRPESIVILDHRPHPLPLFQILSLLYANIKEKPQIIIHIFGDFTLHYESWAKVADLLKGWPLKFVVASERQKILIDKFLPAPQGCYVCPFPVNEREFNYDPSLRPIQRKNWDIDPDDVAFVFTGRITLQKRVLSLVQTFAEVLKKTPQTSAHLYIYGNPDPIADPFLGIWESEGEYFRRVFRFYRSLPAHLQKRIHFMGSVANEELKSVYQGADVLVNLSVHNDEDFGMSVAEAQASGLPAILTDWGGLAGFEHAKLPDATFYVPAQIGKRAKLISLDHVIKGMKKHMSSRVYQDRQEISRVALNKFGIQAAAQILKSIFATEATVFNGFSECFEKIYLNNSLSPTPYIDEMKNINQDFKDIYSAYVRNN